MLLQQIFWRLLRDNILCMHVHYTCVYIKYPNKNIVDLTSRIPNTFATYSHNLMRMRTHEYSRIDYIWLFFRFNKQSFPSDNHHLFSVFREIHCWLFEYGTSKLSSPFFVFILKTLRFLSKSQFYGVKSESVIPVDLLESGWNVV